MKNDIIVCVVEFEFGAFELSEAGGFGLGGFGVSEFVGTSLWGFGFSLGVFELSPSSLLSGSFGISVLLICNSGVS